MAATVTGLRPTAAEETPNENPQAPAASKTDQEISKEMFLKLLVAQIRNQDPLNPINGTEYLTQLAEFTNLEQMMGLRREVEAIRELLAARGAPQAPEGDSATGVSGD